MIFVTCGTRFNFADFLWFQNEYFFQKIMENLAANYPSLIGADGGIVFVAPTPVISMGLLQVIFVARVGGNYRCIKFF